MCQQVCTRAHMPILHARMTLLTCVRAAAGKVDVWLLRAEGRRGRTDAMAEQRMVVQRYTNAVYAAGK